MRIPQIFTLIHDVRSFMFMANSYSNFMSAILEYLSFENCQFKSCHKIKIKGYAKRIRKMG